MRKTGSKTSPKFLCKTCKNCPLYRVQKYSRWGSIPRPDDLSVDRPMVIFMTVGVAGRSPGRRHPGLDLSVDQSANRGKNQSAKLSGRLTARSTEARPESELSGSVDRLSSCARSVHIGQPFDRPTSNSVDRQKARSCLLYTSPSPRDS